MFFFNTTNVEVLKFINVDPIHWFHYTKHRCESRWRNPTSVLIRGHDKPIGVAPSTFQVVYVFQYYGDM